MNDTNLLLPCGTPISANLAAVVIDQAASAWFPAVMLLQQHCGLDLLAARAAVRALRAGEVRIAARPDDPPPSLARLVLDARIDDLLADRPFYWALLSQTLIREDATTPTMAVGVTVHGRIALFYSPAFVLGLTRAQCKAVLVHELNHVLMGHLSDRPVGWSEHRAAWAHAAEASANEFVGYPLPGEPITHTALGLPPMESTGRRFERLKLRPDLPDVGSQDRIMGLLPPDPRAHTDRDGRPRPVLYPRTAIRRAAELARGEATAQARNALAGHTAAGSELAQVLGDGLGVLDWRTLLRRLVSRLGRRRSTRLWPSRRAPDRVGIVPGRRRRRDSPTVLAVVDTSASMSPHQFELISAELRRLLDAGVRVALVQCDAKVHSHEWLGQAPPRQLIGRGDTDLRPPFESSLLRTYRPGLLAYFTDGLGPAPDKRPPGLEVLWVLTGVRTAVPAPWGWVARLGPSSP